MHTAVFNTEQEAIDQREADFQLLRSRVGCPDCITSPAEGCFCDPPRTADMFFQPVKQRNDGKWAYPCYWAQDYTGITTEPYDPADYPGDGFDETIV